MNGVIKLRYDELYRKNTIRTTFRFFHMADPVSVPEQFIVNIIPRSRLKADDTEMEGLQMPPEGGGIVWVNEWWWWDEIVALRRNVDHYFQQHPDEKPDMELKAEDEYSYYPDPHDRSDI